jgi:hypothetical protein
MMDTLVSKAGTIALVTTVGSSKEPEWLGHVVNLDIGRPWPEQSLHTAVAMMNNVEWRKATKDEAAAARGLIR